MHHSFICLQCRPAPGTAPNRTSDMNWARTRNQPPKGP